MQALDLSDPPVESSVFAFRRSKSRIQEIVDGDGSDDFRETKP